MTKKPWLKFAVTVAVGLVLTFCWMLLYQIFNQTDTRAILTILCDSFFITGMLFVSIGGLIMIASTGFFDLLAYGIRSIGILFFPVKYRSDKHENYYDYKERKRQKRIENRAPAIAHWLIFVVGIGFVAVAALFLIGII